MFETSSKRGYNVGKFFKCPKQRMIGINCKSHLQFNILKNNTTLLSFKDVFRHP